MTGTSRLPLYAAAPPEAEPAGDMRPQSAMHTYALKPRERELYDMFVGLAHRVQASPAWSDVEASVRRLFARRDAEDAGGLADTGAEALTPQ